MTPDDLTHTAPPDATRDQSDQALDAGLAAAFAPDADATADRPATADPEAGTVVGGKYRLSERIGEGGMGSVWAATQTEPVKRKVAVKLIKAGMDSKAVLARFEAERQALAVMDHPNIAKVLDGGLHDGRPYFVMELVKGVPITQFCDERKLTPQQRLELFVPVCQAIQHAHQKGVIHRDIKPSNVLVAVYDDQPVPKVIDFGVAKATGASLTEHTLETGFGAVVGTPAYMSPEQASLNNLDIDTRSDVYALGVLLYELLTGTPPFSGAELKKKGLMEMLRVVREEEPPRPSHKLSTADALPSLSASRGTEPKKLTGLLRNELDWIVMKALEKDRARRYETANGFAADVLRYLSGEAVHAHPPSRAYRLKKFVRRNRVQVVAASLVFLALLAGIAGTTLGLVEARKQEAEAKRQEGIARGEASAKEQARRAETEERQKAEVARAEAESVARFFEDRVLAAARPEGWPGGLGHAVSLRNAIVASLPELERGFPDQPLVEARLRLTLGITFGFLGEHEKALEQFKLARALYSRHLGPEHPEALTCMHNMATEYVQLNRRPEALNLYEEVLPLRKRVLPADHPDTLTTMNNLATVLLDLGRLDEALKLHEEVLTVRKRVLPKDAEDTLTGAQNLANCYAKMNRPDEALRLHEEVLAARKRVLPKDHPVTLQSMNNVAGLYGALGRPSDAMTLFSQVLATQKRVLPKDHPETLRSMGNLANSYSDLGRFSDAMKLQEEVLAIEKRVLPKDDPSTLVSMCNLAVSYSDLDRFADALKLREEVLAVRKRDLPKDHPDTLHIMWGVAESLFNLNRGTEAIPLIDECVAKAAGKNVHPELIAGVMPIRLYHFLRANDPAGCRATAEMWEKLNRTDAESLYTAARFRALTAVSQARASPAGNSDRVQADADMAMAWLQQAVKAGFGDAGQLKKNTDFSALRRREDFKKLVADLEAKFPPRKEAPRADK